MENTYTDKIIDMKFDKYDYDEEKNFAANSELLVTITLHEYRNLLQAEVKKERDAEIREKWKLQEQVKELQKQVENLKAAITALKTPIDEDADI